MIPVGQNFGPQGLNPSNQASSNQAVMDPALQQKIMEQEVALVIEEFLEETLAALFEAEIMGAEEYGAEFINDLAIDQQVIAVGSESTDGQGSGQGSGQQGSGQGSGQQGSGQGSEKTSYQEFIDKSVEMQRAVEIQQEGISFEEYQVRHQQDLKGMVDDFRANRATSIGIQSRGRDSDIAEIEQQLSYHGFEDYDVMLLTTDLKSKKEIQRLKSLLNGELLFPISEALEQNIDSFIVMEFVADFIMMLESFVKDSFANQFKHEPHLEDELNMFLRGDGDAQYNETNLSRRRLLSDLDNQTKTGNPVDEVALKSKSKKDIENQVRIQDQVSKKDRLIDGDVVAEAVDVVNEKEQEEEVKDVRQTDIGSTDISLRTDIQDGEAESAGYFDNTNEVNEEDEEIV